MFDAWYPEGHDLDDPLVNSHWVACETLARLHGADIETIQLSGSEFGRHDIRETLEQAGLAGFLYFGHGNAHTLYRELGVPLVVADDLGVVGRRFFVAFACNSGQALGPDALLAGVGAFLGYGVPLVVHWTPERLRDDVRSLLSALTTQGSCMVAQGERSRGAVRGRVRELSDQLVDALAREPLESWGEHVGLLLLASRLHEHLVLEGVDVIP